MAMWAVPAGIVGARVYHVITDWGIVLQVIGEMHSKYGRGGLGILGGVIFGYLAVVIYS